jgi:acylphosphatase
MSRRRVHAIVHGRVQGVFFRKYTSLKAQELGLDGWVRNLPDQTVEVVFEGEDGAVAKMLEWLYVGPSNSKVSSVDFSEQEAGIDSGGFSVRY